MTHLEQLIANAEQRGIAKGLRMAARDAALAEKEWRASVAQKIMHGDPYIFSGGMAEANRRLKVKLRLQARAIMKGAKARG